MAGVLERVERGRRPVLWIFGPRSLLPRSDWPAKLHMSSPNLNQNRLRRVPRMQKASPRHIVPEASLGVVFPLSLSSLQSLHRAVNLSGRHAPITALKWLSHEHTWATRGLCDWSSCTMGRRERVMPLRRVWPVSTARLETLHARSTPTRAALLHANCTYIDVSQPPLRFLHPSSTSKRTTTHYTEAFLQPAVNIKQDA